MSIALAAYLLLGPILWAGLAILAAMGHRRMDRLRAGRVVLPDVPPTLSILVPARDEAADIRECVERILRQDYPNAQVVVVNDRSTDGTGAILDTLAADEPRLRVVHVCRLPDGWLGKCHALFVGTQGLTSDWLLFVDSDVHLSPDAAGRALSYASVRNYDALSLMTRLIAPTFWEKTLLPILAMTWGAAFQISLTNDDSRRSHALANGQFFLIRRSVYESAGGHEAVRDQIVEDVALMRVLKHHGARVRLLLGKHLAATRMHANLRQMFRGWARIFAGTSGRSAMPMLATIAFLTLTLALLVAGASMAFTLGGAWTIALAAHAAIVVGFLAWTYRSAGQNPVNALLFPITWPMTLMILAYAVYVCRSGKVDWRGNTVLVNSRRRRGGKEPQMNTDEHR